MEKAKADAFFEASWEVCNKVGGIYTVVKSKIEYMQKYYGDYFLIGPYFEDKAKVELEECDAPDFIKRSFDALSSKGLKFYYGKWNVKGEPNAILIDFQNLYGKKDEIKGKLWEWFSIDSIKSSHDFEEPMAWCWAIGMLLEEIRKNYPAEKKIVAHFHEWMAGIALLYLKAHKIGIGSVFTTHATMLGRAIAGNGIDLYALLDKINPDEEAYRLNVQDKYLTEKACAYNADVFTTVSEITGLEAEKLFGKKPDVLVLNGFNVGNFPTFEETSVRHISSREKLREFLTFYFFPYYAFDIKNTLLFFIVGRYEFRNKGLDIFIKALSKLNNRLKEEKSKMNAAVFIWIPGAAKGIKMEVLENKNLYRHIKNYVTYKSDSILSKIVYDLVSGGNISSDSIFSKDFMLDVKKDLIHFTRKGLPPLVSHYLENEDNDMIIRALHENCLNNLKEDKVKVILFPVYVDGNDGLINLSYYDAMAGCHLGVFPSYYEPWGYTPVESAALGVPAITTDLAGFGRYIRDKIEDVKKKECSSEDADEKEECMREKEEGIYVLERLGKDENEVISVFADIMHDYLNKNKNERVRMKENAKKLVNFADWEILSENYIKAHNMAIDKLE